MIESDDHGRFTLQPVIMEFVAEHFVEQIYKEIYEESPALLASHALMKAQAKEYLRRSQVHFILAPLVERLLASWGRAKSENKLKQLLSRLHMLHTGAPIGHGG